MNPHTPVARALFQTLEQRFSHLRARWADDSSPHSSLEITFEEQPGLVFPVSATLQGDELGLAVGSTFFCTWFSCANPSVAAEFDDAVRGVLSGRIRLVDHMRGDRVSKAVLQDSASSYWTTIATSGGLRWPSLRKSRPRALRNRLRGFDLGLIADLRDSEDTGEGAFLEAWQAIATESTSADLPSLRAFLEDRDALVREAVAAPIAELEGLAQLPALLTAYQRGLDEGHDNDGFTAILIDLVSGDPTAARDSLNALLLDQRPAIRENAAWLLEHCDAALS